MIAADKVPNASGYNVKPNIERKFARLGYDMSEQENTNTQFKQILKQMIAAWAAHRKHKDGQSLQDFLNICETSREAALTEKFSALVSAIDSIALTIEKNSNLDQDPKRLIKEVDWLMNQLIKSSQESNSLFVGSASTNTPAQSNKIVSKLTSRSKERPSVVVIDDQASVATVLCKTLEDFGLSSCHFIGIKEFLAAQDTISVDLILLDIVMPDVTQQQVFEFASDMVRQGIKVISCSSTFTFETRLMAVRAGVCDYVVKPVNSYVLVEKIGRAFGLQGDRKHKVVLVDDQETMGSFYKTMLEQVGCEVTYFPTATELFDNIDDLAPDMFLLDMLMPNVDGLEVARMLRQEHKLDFAPILFLTADEEVENRLAALDAGADDVISKSSSVSVIVRQLLTRLERAAQVRAFVAKDPLTGVLNHGQIVETANQSIRLAARRKQPASLAVIDVDHFKNVNDTRGHVTGDKVLCALGQMLASSVRETDKVGRYGGEEFVIIFEDCSAQDAVKKTQMIKDKFGGLDFNSDTGTFNVTFSAGIVELTNFDTIMPAIAVADKALYQAKELGRNRVIEYTSESALRDSA